MYYIYSLIVHTIGTITIASTSITVTMRSANKGLRLRGSVAARPDKLSTLCLVHCLSIRMLAYQGGRSRSTDDDVGFSSGQSKARLWADSVDSLFVNVHPLANVDHVPLWFTLSFSSFEHSFSGEYWNKMIK